MIRLFRAIELPPGGSSTVHTYTQTIHRTTQLTTRRAKLTTEKKTINNKTQLTRKGKSVGRAPSLRVVPWHLPYN